MDTLPIPILKIILLKSFDHANVLSYHQFCPFPHNNIYLVCKRWNSIWNEPGFKLDLQLDLYCTTLLSNSELRGIITSEDIQVMFKSNNRINSLRNRVKDKTSDLTVLKKFQNLTQRSLSAAFHNACSNYNLWAIQKIDELFSQVFDYARYEFGSGVDSFISNMTFSHFDLEMGILRWFTQRGKSLGGNQFTKLLGGLCSFGCVKHIQVLCKSIKYDPNDSLRRFVDDNGLEVPVIEAEHLLVLSLRSQNIETVQFVYQTFCENILEQRTCIRAAVEKIIAEGCPIQEVEWVLRYCSSDAQLTNKLATACAKINNYPALYMMLGLDLPLSLSCILIEFLTYTPPSDLQNEIKKLYSYFCNYPKQDFSGVFSTFFNSLDREKLSMKLPEIILYSPFGENKKLVGCATDYYTHLTDKMKHAIGIDPVLNNCLRALQLYINQ